MDGNFFFVIGIVLVIAAVAISVVGIRGSATFPASRGVMAGVIALFVAVVGTTMAFAVVKSVDEQDERNEELAKEEQEAEGTTEAPPGQQPAGAATTLDVSSPDDGGLVFEPDGLTAKAGNVTIDYDNPSPTPHSIAVATANGNVLGEVQPFTAGEESLDLTDLAPGEYVFYCTVPGHRENGMEGDLTVSGGPTP